MSNAINSPNMMLPVPVVGQDPGPQYAVDVNNCLTIVDGHNHAPGSGVQINPNGLNINSDLTMLNNNLTSAKSVRFQSQASPLSGSFDLGCIYESGVDLFYNDGNGNQIRITQSGGIAGTPGSISNLTSPASASYVALTDTFVWQSAANTPANLDAASIILRDLVANSFGLTLSPPASMGADYSLTLPSLPTTQSIMTLDASGIMSAPYTVDNNTIVITSNVIQVGPNSIGPTQITANSIGAGQLVPENYASVSISGSFGASTLLMGSATFTSTGRPVQIILVDDGTNSGNSFIEGNGNTTNTFAIHRGVSTIATTVWVCPSSGTTLPSGSISFFDAPPVGSTSYNLYCTSNGTTTISHMNMIVIEL